MKKALVFHGGYEGHNPEGVANILASILKDNGFSVVISNTLECLEDKKIMKEVDLIVPNWTMGTISREQLEVLLLAVENGTGIAGLHGGLGDAFRNETKFQFMTGGQFVAHPGGDGVLYEVEFDDKHHVITKGLENFTVSTELYYMHFDPAINILASTRTNGIKMPVVWTKPFGNGKVFYCSLGHSVDIVKRFRSDEADGTWDDLGSKVVNFSKGETRMKTKIGIIGTGNISNIYLENLTKVMEIDLIGCADIHYENALEKSRRFGVPALSLEEILHSEAELIINLTTPNAHFQVSKDIISANKHVYVEKPLTISREDALTLLSLAEEKGRLIGGAPDTFLGAGIQTCRKLIDEGIIGEPIAATAFMMSHGHESWHPNPEFYYQEGGGPLFDMGPYYLTALVNLVGPIKRVSASTRITFPERTITSMPKKGEVIQVKIPTHVAGTLEFENGAIGTIITSFDIWGTNLPHIEIYGTKGSMRVPNPNHFDGDVWVKKENEAEWNNVPLVSTLTPNLRGLGVMDMVQSLREGVPHRANGELAFHVLDVMHAMHESSNEGKHVQIQKRNHCIQPSPLKSAEYDKIFSGD